MATPFTPNKMQEYWGMFDYRNEVITAYVVGGHSFTGIVDHQAEASLTVNHVEIPICNVVAVHLHTGNPD